MLLYLTLAFTIHGKVWKSHTKIINLKYQLQHGIKFEVIDGSYSISDIQDYFKYILKEDETVTDNPSIIIYVNKVENRIMFKIEKRILSCTFNSWNNENTWKF